MSHKVVYKTISICYHYYVIILPSDMIIKIDVSSIKCFKLRKQVLFKNPCCEEEKYWCDMMKIRRNRYEMKNEMKNTFIQSIVVRKTLLILTPHRIISTAYRFF